MKIKHSQLIDTSTGEIHSDKTQIVNYFNEEGYLLFVKRNYSRVFSDIRIPDEFTDSELGKIYRLQAYIQQGTNMIIKRMKRGYKPMDANDMYQSMNLSDRQGKEFIKKLMDNKIIAKVTVEYGGKGDVSYYFNPLYFHNSKRLSVGLYNLFTTDIDPYINDWVKKAFAENKETLKDV
jgi:hypothetical protein